MKKLVTIVGFAGMVLLLALGLGAWTDSPESSVSPRLITVTGDAEVRVVPDEVILTLGVETWDKKMDRATRQNDEIVSSILALATRYGISPEHVQTDYVNIEPRYRNGYYEESDFIGFFVRKSIVITLRDLAQFEPLLKESLEAGVNHVLGIEFRTTKLRQYRDEARALAIRAAEEKAVALAGELGQQIGQPHNIQEVQSGWWSGYRNWWGGWGNPMAQNVIQELGSTASGDGGSVAPGQINVNAKVSVTFELRGD